MFFSIYFQLFYQYRPNHKKYRPYTSLYRAWEDYFKDQSIQITVETGNTHLDINQNTLIQKCTFENINYGDKGGGAIYVSQENLFVLVDTCSFINCSSLTGGAIKSENVCNIVIEKSCSNGCTAHENYQGGQGNGQFCYIIFGKSIDNDSIINYTSVVFSIEESMTRTINQAYGKQLMKYVNISGNKCRYASAYNTWHANSCDISYTSFSNNTDKEKACILLEGPYCEIRIMKCNVLKNAKAGEADSSSIILLKYEEEPKIYNLYLIDCCIVLNNPAKTVFDVKKGTILFYNCTVDSFDSIKGSAVFRSTPEEGFILPLTGYAAEKCQVQTDFVKNIKVMGQTDSNDIYPHNDSLFFALILFVLIKN